jgi:hypothetical protein
MPVLIPSSWRSRTISAPLLARPGCRVPAQPTCEVPNVNASPTYRGDPDWAVPDAERVANAMLENVTL